MPSLLCMLSCAPALQQATTAGLQPWLPVWEGHCGSSFKGLQAISAYMLWTFSCSSMHVPSVRLLLLASMGWLPVREGPQRLTQHLLQKQQGLVQEGVVPCLWYDVHLKRSNQHISTVRAANTVPKCCSLLVCPGGSQTKVQHIHAPA